MAQKEIYEIQNVLPLFIRIKKKLYILYNIQIENIFSISSWGMQYVCIYYEVSVLYTFHRSIKKLGGGGCQLSPRPPPCPKNILNVENMLCFCQFLPLFHTSPLNTPLSPGNFPKVLERNQNKSALCLISLLSSNLDFFL